MGKDDCGFQTEGTRMRPLTYSLPVALKAKECVRDQATTLIRRSVPKCRLVNTVNVHFIAPTAQACSFGSGYEIIF